MADTLTTLLSLTKPQVGVQDPITDWGVKWNTNLDTVDAKWTSTTPTTQASGDSAAAGTSLFVARADHKHGMPTLSPPQNILRNANFEDFTNTGTISNPANGDFIMPGWVCSKNGTPTTDYSKDTTAANVDSGLASIKLNNTGVGGGTPKSAIQQNITNYWDYLGKTLTLSVRVKTSLTGVQARITDSSGSTDATAHTGDGTFQTLTVTRAISSSATSLSIQIGYTANTITGTGSLWVDSAMLVIGSAATTFDPRANWSKIVDRITMYRRPVLQFGSTTTVAVEGGLDGTSGDIGILFPDGDFRTETSATLSTLTVSQNAVLSGTKQSGIRSGAVANNTWYACYGVKATDTSTDWVTVADTVLPTQANFGTLNTNFGTVSWVYLGLMRYGDGQGVANAVLDFVQCGNFTQFKNSLTVSNDAVVTPGIQFAQTASAASLTYTYSAGTGATNVPNNISHIYWKIFGAGSSAQMYQFLDSGGTRVYVANVGSAAAVKGAYQAIIPASEGIKSTISTANSMELVVAGFWDAVLGGGSNSVI